MIIVTEHGRYRLEGEGPVYLTVLEMDAAGQRRLSRPIGVRWREDRPLRVRVGLHMVFWGDQQLAEDGEAHVSNRILALLPDEEA